MYPFFYRPMYTIMEDGWTAFQLETEFAKLVGGKSDEWRISTVNKDFEVGRPSLSCESTFDCVSLK
jgi:myotubularin-related protein 9